MTRILLPRASEARHALADVGSVLGDPFPGVFDRLHGVGIVIQTAIAGVYPPITRFIAWSPLADRHPRNSTARLVYCPRFCPLTRLVAVIQKGVKRPSSPLAGWGHPASSTRHPW